MILNEKGIHYLQRLLDYHGRGETVEPHVAYIEKVFSSRPTKDDAGHQVLAELIADEVIVREFAEGES